MSENKLDVTICGGTHGNEYTGVYLLECMKQRGFEQKYPKLNINYLLTNPAAYLQAKRFVDHDLNRSFLKADLANPHLGGYEANRAKVINQLMGPKGEKADGFVLDFHTTTANMGVSLILRYLTPRLLGCCAYVKAKMPEARIYYMPWNGDEDADPPYLDSVLRDGICLEVGPVANAVVRAEILDETAAAANHILDYLSLTAAEQAVFRNQGKIEVFQYVETVYFPEHDGHVFSGFIHEGLQDRDYTLLKKGDPVFRLLNGETVYWDREEPLYPVFINEAAYYYEHKAFSLTKRVWIDPAELNG